MNKSPFVLTVLSAVVIAVAGCSKQSGDNAATPPAASSASSDKATASVDTSKLVAAFQSADPNVKMGVNTAVSLIQGGDKSDALQQLKGIAARQNLTDEQQTAIKDVIAKLQ
ncbi:MAG TPA: hypothetical protein VFY06_15250 [Verrucomicrobiae bacterium]|nr:hypothetical protein [Verrucomicrobiae bacterium]